MTRFIENDKSIRREEKISRIDATSDIGRACNDIIQVLLITEFDELLRGELLRVTGILYRFLWNCSQQKKLRQSHRERRVERLRVGPPNSICLK